MKLVKYLPALALLLTLTACGGGPEPPVNYDYDTGDSLPSLSAAVALPEETAFSEEEDAETGAVTYHYEGLTDTGSYVSQYIDILERMYTCSVIDAQGVLQAEQSVSGDTGDIYVGAEAPGGGGVLQLHIVWDEASCSISPALLADQKITEPEPETSSSSSLTLDEAIQFFQKLSPATLGLDGSSMAAYEIYPDEGLVMVDNQPCIPVKVYGGAERRFAGSYLLSLDGSRLYQTDLSSDQVQELPIP